MEAFIAELKSVPLAKGVDEVFYPGEMEARSDSKLRREGIELPEDTVTELDRMGERLGIRLDRK
jgi:LDH2 family malate/lactate/ureidoglycolate dehydrogenase